jgi:ribosome recycling factor
VISDVVNDAERRMLKAAEAAQHDYQGIRTGRANPALLDRVTVDYYGSAMPVNQVATISVPEPRQIVIAPWDKAAVQQIERAILKSDLGLTPMSDGNVVRLNIPTLTEERRRDLIKQLHKKAEEHRVAVRNVRRDANEDLKRMEKAGEVSEDDVHRAQEQTQKLTEKYIVEIDHLTKAKEEELLEV